MSYYNIEIIQIITNTTGYKTILVVIYSNENGEQELFECSGHLVYAVSWYNGNIKTTNTILYIKLSYLSYVRCYNIVA